MGIIWKIRESYPRSTQVADSYLPSFLSGTRADSGQIPSNDRRYSENGICVYWFQNDFLWFQIQQELH